jgi:hypothetical protein
MRFLVALGLLLGALLVVERSSVVEPVETTPMASSRSLAPAPRPADRRADLVAGLAVLRDWDARRAGAWTRADAAQLRSLYVRGSSAGRADVRLLAAYRGRGLVVRRLVTQVFAVTVRHRDDHLLRLRVFDRIAGGQVLDHGRPAPLGSTRPVTREVVLRRVEGTWRVAQVSGSARAPRAGPR